MKQRQKKKKNRVISILFAVLLLVMILPAAYADEGSITQIIKTIQTVEGSPKKTSYVYVLIQTNGTDITSNISERKFTLSGNDSHSITVKFTEPGQYEFTMGRLQDESKDISTVTLDNLYKDDSVVPIKHPFGYKVTRNEDGTLSVMPYTCYDNHVEFLKDGSGIELSNLLKGPEELAPTPTPSTTLSPTPTGKVTSAPSSSTNNSGKGQYNPKTGDEFQMRLWITLAGVSIFSIILILLLGKRRKKEENDI